MDTRSLQRGYLHATNITCSVADEKNKTFTARTVMRTKLGDGGYMGSAGKMSYTV